MLKDSLLDEICPMAIGTNVTTDGNTYDIDLHSKMIDFWDMFASGKLEESVKCEGCNTISQTTVPFKIYTVQFPNEHFHVDPIDTKKTINLLDLIRNSQVCSDDDELGAVHCSICKSRQRKQKTSRISSYPKVLCVEIGRKRSNNVTITNAVQYPLEGLKLDADDRSHNNGEEHCTFNLLAAVHHEPNSNDRGHYTAVTKYQRTNRWVMYNDDMVDAIKFNGRVNNYSAVSFQRKVSMLFYEIDLTQSFDRGEVHTTDGQNCLTQLNSNDMTATNRSLNDARMNDNVGLNSDGLDNDSLCENVEGNVEPSRNAVESMENNNEVNVNSVSRANSVDSSLFRDETENINIDDETNNENISPIGNGYEIGNNNGNISENNNDDSSEDDNSSENSHHNSTEDDNTRNENINQSKLT